MSKREDPLILSIETATRVGSIALLRGRECLSRRTGDPTRSHSTDLLELIEGVLKEVSLGVKDVDLFAVALGPGSFTGLRIGVATAKSFASTLERKVVGVPTLAAVALAAGKAERVVALLPAGRGELFAQSFKVDNSVSVKALDEPMHIPPVALLEMLGHTRAIIWAGEGAHAQREKISEYAQEVGIPFSVEMCERDRDSVEGWVLAKPVENLGAYVGMLAFEKYRLDETSKPEELHAIYVRPSDAELKAK